MGGVGGRDVDRYSFGDMVAHPLFVTLHDEPVHGAQGAGYKSLHNAYQPGECRLSPRIDAVIRILADASRQSPTNSATRFGAGAALWTRSMPTPICHGMLSDILGSEHICVKISGVDRAEGRFYAGMTSADRSADRRVRLLAVGLDLMGTPALGPITVRKVLAQSGLAPRYFYDHFTDLNELQLAVFNQLVEEAEHLAKRAMVTAAHNPRARTRAVLDAMVNFMLDDPRKGRVLLIEPMTSLVLGPCFMAEQRRFAGLLARYSPAVWDGEDAAANPVKHTTQFAIGGFATVMAAVMAEGPPEDRTPLLEDLTTMFVGLGATYKYLSRQPRRALG